MVHLHVAVPHSECPVRAVDTLKAIKLVVHVSLLTQRIAFLQPVRVRQQKVQNATVEVDESKGGRVIESKPVVL